MSEEKLIVTVENLVQETGMAKRTICLAINKRGWSRHGVKTLLTREQADQIKIDLIANATQYKTGAGNRAMSTVSETVQGSLTLSNSDPRLKAIKIAEDIKRNYEAVLKSQEELLQCKNEIIAQLQAESIQKDTTIIHQQEQLVEKEVEVAHADNHANYVIGLHQWHGEQSMKKRVWLPYKDD